MVHIQCTTYNTVADPGISKWEGRGRIFRSGVCFDAPSHTHTHTHYVFDLKVVNKIHIVNIVC